MAALFLEATDLRATLPGAHCEDLPFASMLHVLIVEDIVPP